MEIESKSLFTYLDLSMDHFKISMDVREKFLIWSAEFFEITDDQKKKWSKVGKGIDYYTFKNWISKENRFLAPKLKWPTQSYSIKSHYHKIESVLEMMCENSYEELLHFYHALSLLALVDKKYLLPRVEFLEWTATSLGLEEDDCSIIRDFVVDEFDLSFDITDLKQSEKEDIYLNGVKMAYLSGDMIDHKEETFLNNLIVKLGDNFIHIEDKYFINYLTSSFSKNNYHSSLAMHKIGAILLSIIGCDDSVDKREGAWFKQNLSGLDNKLLSDFLVSSVTSLIDNLNDEDKLLCYILGLEVSLRDNVIHKNEAFWLNYIYNSISCDFKMDRDLSLVLIESIARNKKHLSKYEDFYKRVSNFFNSSFNNYFSSWTLITDTLYARSKESLFSKLFSIEVIELTEHEKNQEMIYLSHALNSIPNSEHLLSGLNRRIVHNISSSKNLEYGEMLLSEILKISFLDNEIDMLEDDFLRELQYRFNISEKKLHQVIFTTAFLLGRKIELSPRVNYSYL